MVIKLGERKKTATIVQAPTILVKPDNPMKDDTQVEPISSKFKLKYIEWLFSDEEGAPRNNWKKFYEENKNKLHPDNLDIYEWCVFPLITKEDHFYRCVLHPTVDVNAGNKVYTFFYKNINFSEVLSHCLFYNPEEHKQYIIQKIFKKDSVSQQ